MSESKSGGEEGSSGSESDHSLPETKVKRGGWGEDTIGQSAPNMNSDNESDDGDSKTQRKAKPRKRRSQFR